MRVFVDFAMMIVEGVVVEDGQMEKQKRRWRSTRCTHNQQYAEAFD